MKLKISKENGHFVIERVNDFNHSFKRYFLTEEGLKEGLDAYKDKVDDYKVEASKEVFSLVVNHLNA